MDKLTYQVKERIELIKTPFFKVEKKIVEDNVGKQFSRLVIEKAPAAVLIPISPEGKVGLVRQWRAGSEKFMLELPAGVVDPGEIPAEAAMRELREETGYRSDCLHLLGECYVTPGWCSERYYFFLAEILVWDPLPQDEDENLELLWLPFEDAINHPRILDDAKSWLGLLAAERFLHKRRISEEFA